MTLGKRAFLAVKEMVEGNASVPTQVVIVLRHLREAVAEAQGPQTYGMSARQIEKQVAAGNPAFVEVVLPPTHEFPVAEVGDVVMGPDGLLYRYDGKSWWAQRYVVEPACGRATEEVTPEVIVE